jgi:hypothetical protein
MTTRLPASAGHDVLAPDDYVSTVSGQRTLDLASALDAASASAGGPAGVDLWDDFVTGGASGVLGWSTQVAAATIATRSSGVVVGRPGQLAFTTTANGGRANLFASTSSAPQFAFPGSDGTLTFAVGLFLDALPTVAEAFHVQVGLTDSNGGSGEPANGLYLYCDETTANWRLRVRDASATTTDADTGVAVVAGTWLHLRVDGDGGGSGGVGRSASTAPAMVHATASLPAVSVNASIRLLKTAGNTNRSIFVDWARIVMRPTTPR